jgi:uncharacterized membrane protein YbhN (UPF0104 family)
MKLLKRILTVIVVAVIFYFLIVNLIQNWQRIPFGSLRLNAANLAISFVFLFVNFGIFVQGWRALIDRLGYKISFGNALWIISSSQIAKYVPGGIWFAVGRVFLGRSEKIKEEVVAFSVVVETGLTFLAGILLVLLSVSTIGHEAIGNLLFIVPAFFLFLIALYPPFLNRLMNTALRIIKRPAINLNIPYSTILLLSVYFLGLWIAQVIGFYFLINSIYPLPISKIFDLTAVYILSWMTGFVVIFAPGGLGVREGMMTLLLSSILPAPLAIAVSFIARVWITLFEVVVFFAGLLVKKSVRK